MKRQNCRKFKLTTKSWKPVLTKEEVACASLMEESCYEPEQPEEKDAFLRVSSPGLLSRAAREIDGQRRSYSLESYKSNTKSKIKTKPVCGNLSESPTTKAQWGRLSSKHKDRLAINLTQFIIVDRRAEPQHFIPFATTSQTGKSKYTRALQDLVKNRAGKSHSTMKVRSQKSMSLKLESSNLRIRV